MDKFISNITNKSSKVKIAGDFNAKFTAWGGDKVDKRRRMIMETMDKYLTGEGSE
jgi:hypothetical protein